MKLGLEDEEVQVYLKALNIPEKLNLINLVETLYLLSNRQFIHFLYQNIDLHLRQKKPKSLTPQALLQRLCIEKVGGLCYEQELLLYYVLQHLKYDVHPIRCQVREPGSKYNPEQPYTHDLLIVILEAVYYIVDPGFGFRSLKFPFQVNFSNLPSYCEFSSQEQFRISENETHYQLEQLINDNWVSYYDFQKPLKLGNILQTENDYLNLYTYPKYLGPRDSRFVICQNNEFGRIIYMWLRLEKQFTAFRKIITQSNVEKIEFKNFEDFKDDIYNMLYIELPNFEQF